jgi:putative membrane protein
MMNFAHGGNWASNGWGSNSFGHMGIGGFGGSIFGWILMALFAALVITGLVYLVKNMNKNFDSGRKNNNYRQLEYRQENKEDAAKGIARERYAKGEINKEELKEILNNLNS